jgi:hypothetical protein
VHNGVPPFLPHLLCLPPYQEHKPPKPRCEVSCRGLHGTGQQLASVVTYPLRAPGSTPLCSCLPLVWGAASGGRLHPQNSWDQSGNPSFKTNQSSGLKRKEVLPSGEIPMQNPSSESWKIWHTIRGHWRDRWTLCWDFGQRQEWTTGPRAPLWGVSGTGTTHCRELAGLANKHREGEDLGRHRLRPVRKASWCYTWKLRHGQAIQELGAVSSQEM